MIALTDAELEALEKQIEEKEQASKRQAEEAARKQEEARRKAEAKKRAEAEAKRKAEEARLRRQSEQREADLEQQQADLEQQREQEERMRLEMEQQKAEESARQAELERIRQEEEARIRAEVERKQQYEMLHATARRHMDNEEYNEAIEVYQIILDTYSGDVLAGKEIEKARNYMNNCQAIVGQWRVAPHSIFWEVYENNTVHGEWLIFSASGIWECLSARERKFVVSWPDCAVCITESFILSEDGNTLNPTNRNSLTVGRRFGGSQSGSDNRNSSPPAL